MAEREEPGGVDEPVEVAPSDRVVRTEGVVRSEDDMIQTTEDVVSTSSDVVAPSVVTTESGVRVLSERFGPLYDAEYVPGKTAFRDALAEDLQISELDAEDLCDELERMGRIAFVRIGDTFGWHVHEASEGTPRQ
jgi:hypothetical protein